MKSISIMLAVLALLPARSATQDILNTQAGAVSIHFVGHASLYFRFNNKIIHVDPWSRMANYDTLPKADLILLTHQHRDHLDTIALNAITTPHTYMIIAPVCLDYFKPKVAYETITNDHSTKWDEIGIEAVAAYNIVHKRPNGVPYHPKGEGNGYILSMGGKRIYVAGDTENIPEMEQLGTIDIAFLPVNLPFTMSPEMLADAVQKIRPAVVYPYHYGQTDLKEVHRQISAVSEAEVRIR